MASTKTRALVETTAITRVQAVQRSAEHFIDRTGEYGANWGVFAEEIEVICAMKLINDLEVVCRDADGKDVAGLVMKFDWVKGQAIIENGDDEYDPSLLDEFGRPASVTESVDAMCSYLDAVRAETDGFHIRTWFGERPERKSELGAERYYRLLGMPVPTDAQRQEWNEEYGEVRKAKEAGDSLESSNADVELVYMAWRIKDD